MALEIYAFLSALPDRRDWQAAIEKTRVDFQLDPEIDLNNDRGSLPVRSRERRPGSSCRLRPLPRYSATIRLPSRPPGHV